MQSAITPPHPLVLSMPKGELLKLCFRYGRSLEADLTETDDGQGSVVSGARLLWAISGRESSFGQNMKPRFEPAYFTGGYYWNRSPEVRQGCALYGRDFACSYGPLQILAVNAKGFTPLELGSDPEKALGAAIAFMRIEVLGRQKARTIPAICDAWNTGNCKDKNVPMEYIGFVMHKYLTEVIAE